MRCVLEDIHFSSRLQKCCLRGGTGKSWGGTAGKPSYFAWEGLWETSLRQWCWSWPLRDQRGKRVFQGEVWPEKPDMGKLCGFRSRIVCCCCWKNSCLVAGKARVWRFQFYSRSGLLISVSKPGEITRASSGGLWSKDYDLLWRLDSKVLLIPASCWYIQVL